MTFKLIFTSWVLSYYKHFKTEALWDFLLFFFACFYSEDFSKFSYKFKDG